MSRYLTAAKLALLVLVSTYVAGVVPAKATVRVLSFLVAYLLPANFNRDGQQYARNHLLTVEDFQNTLSGLQSGIPGRTVWDLFLKKLWEIESFDSLTAFFETVANSVAKTREQLARDREGTAPNEPGRIRLSRTSPLGIFVRRAQVEFTRLQFDDGLALWKAYAVYRGFDVVSAAGFDKKVHNVSYRDIISGVTHVLSSSDDLDALLEFQIERMQKMSQRLPDEMKRQFRKMIESGLMVPNRSYYIKYLDAWKAGDYVTSFDNLHRYFDYTMQSRHRTFYQYALLNLAILQADFGCYGEAVTAMHETISTARENKDTACLNYSLSWLFHFGKAHPRELNNERQTGVLGTDKEALLFLKTKAREAGMWSLLSTSLLAEARNSHLNGESLALAFEGVTKASHLILTRNLDDSVGAQMNVESSIFSRIGQQCLAWSCNELFLECYSRSSSAEDVLHSLCRAALLESSRGHFSAAFSILESSTLESLRTLKHQLLWSQCMTLLSLRRALYLSDVVSAEHYLAQLKANSPQSPEIVFSIAYYSIDLESRKGQLPKAMELLEGQRESMVAGEGDVYHKIRLMILKAQIYDRAGLPQKGFSIAIRAASLAHKACYLSILWDAVGVLCKVLVSLDEFDAAIKLLKAIIPRALETEERELAARLFSHLADAYMGLAGEAMASSLKRRQNMNRVLECLERAFDEHSQIGNLEGQCEMMAKKATIMHLNGDLVLANDYAAKYLDLQKKAKEDMITTA